VISPEAICKKISHLVSALKTFGRRRATPFSSATKGSSLLGRGASHCWFVSRWTLRAKVRRRTVTLTRKTNKMAGTEVTFDQLTEPTPTQRRAFELLGILIPLRIT